MSYDPLTASVPYPFGVGQAITFSYPPGRSAEDYSAAGAILVVGTDTLRQGAEAFFVTYGPSSIRVLYNGPYQAAGAVTLRAPLSTEADVAGSPNHVVLTEAAYSALSNPDGNTIYYTV